MKNIFINHTPGATKKESTITQKEFLESVQPNEKKYELCRGIYLHPFF